jgi:hypothetical protein
MAIPFAKDLIDISRVDDSTVDGWDDNPPTPIQTASGVRAVVSLPSAAPNLVGGDRIVYNATMTCDLCDLQANDTVTDSQGTQWRCLTVVTQIGLGLDHMAANLRLVSGAAT